MSLCVIIFFVSVVLTKHSNLFERIFIRSFFIADARIFARIFAIISIRNIFGELNCVRQRTAKRIVFTADWCGVSVRDFVFQTLQS